MTKVHLHARLLWLLLLLATGLGQLHARHIIGGVMTYECLGNDRYRFRLEVYRDCLCTNCAELDPVANIGVYRCNGMNDCGFQSQSNPFMEVTASLNELGEVEAPDYPCLIPPNICVEGGFYEFTLTLPQSDLSYFVAYQRCCRNVTINNILDPDNVGATFMIELTPAAQEVCNSSPVFDTYPPTVLCALQDFSYDHSATDPDGDDLVYEFCSPLVGGGPLLDPLTYNTCNGANPIPACPPPYGNVTFLTPTYSPTQPVPGEPPISIDGTTGLISGVPSTQGQYVVGVCVSEYRNGVLLSRVFRDFQFNVANCDPTVVADIEEDAMIADQEFVVNSCGDFTIDFRNQSFQQQFIDNYQWTFDLGNGQVEELQVWEPSVTFPGIGQYQGQLVLNENTDCGDTANIIVNIFPDIAADFSFAYDTCVAGAVAFTDESFTGACCLTGWQWQFGDGSASQLQDPFHTYTEPGVMPVTLTVRDTNQCVASLTQEIAYFPVPALIVVAPSAAVACQPASIFFDNLSVPIDSTYDILWDFGDGGAGTDISPTHLYEDPGTFTVSVDIISPIGCQTDTTFDNLVTILPSPVAGFSYAPETPSNLFPEVSFTDQSEGAIAWQWWFGERQGAGIPNPTHVFPDTGLYEVLQIVSHPSGCMDTARVLLDVIPEVRYFLPNAFTPNGDGANDTFRGKGVLPGATNFNLTIWNRWGEPLFRTEDPFAGWNGRKNNVGEEAPPGVYLVLVTFTGPRGEPYEIKGQATLVR